MKYEGVSFNPVWVLKHTQEQFKNHKSNQHLWPSLSVTQRKARLVEAYQLIKNANN